MDEALKGFEDVKDSIEDENFYIRAGAGDDTDVETISEIISDGAALRYVFSARYTNPTILKDEIRVLHIEPTNDFSDLDEAKILKWANDEKQDIIKTITIDTMNISEFIGKIDDVNENYDLIYIGTNIGEPGANGSYNQINGITDYNDSNMNGLIYTHVGDLIQAQVTLNGIMNEDYLSQNLDGKPTDSTRHFYVQNDYRYSGSDLTEDAYEKLKDFAESGYPMIFSEDFYNVEEETKSRTVNTERIDNSSYMYRLANDILSRENVMNVDAEGKVLPYRLFNKYLNMPKLRANMSVTPPEYAYNLNSDGIQVTSQLETDGNGRYTLNYEFELEDIAAFSPETTRYRARLYIDANGDGQYMPQEEMDSLYITEASTGNQVAYDQLKADTKYQLSRSLPDDYVGVVSWNLSFNQNGSDGIRTSASGYTALAVKPGQKETIKVLQINNSNGNGNTTLNLENQLYSGNRERTDTVFGALINTLEGFDVEVTTIGVNQYNNRYNTYDLNEYDMLIFGFEDMYGNINSGEPINKIKAFINEGKAVLFSYDTVSYFNGDRVTYYSNSTGRREYWGYSFSSQVRALLGMDRFGVRTDGLEGLRDLTSDTVRAGIPSLWQAIASYDKDYAYLPKSGSTAIVSEVQGYSDMILNTYFGGGAKGYRNRIYSGSMTSTTASKVNDGQMTNFPYKIADNIGTAETGGQYYQLDMNMDGNGDGASDMVVWYTLSGGYYDAVAQDVRNNYYTYSVGNITYTGLGHSSSSSWNNSGNAASDYEAQLFVNTIIQAYRASVQKPTVSMISDPNNWASEEDYIYLTYDEGELLDADADMTVFNYTLSDSNIIQGDKHIELTYYYSADDGEDKVFGDETVKVKAFTTTTRKKVDGGWEDAGGTDNLESGRVYQADMPAEILERVSSNLNEPIKIYIEARTVLNQTVNNQQRTDYSAYAFDQISIVPRSLFNLD